MKKFSLELISSNQDKNEPLERLSVFVAFRLIIDELGYVDFDVQGSQLFFQVISARHDAGLGLVVTTNLNFSQFNQIFANEAVATVVVDRMVNEAEIFYMEGESYRKHQREMKAQKKEKSESASKK